MLRVSMNRATPALRPPLAAHSRCNAARALATQSVADRTIDIRKRLLSPTYDVFQTFDVPLVIERAEMQYMFDTEGNRYLDLLANNLTISVGHNHPTVVGKVKEQLDKICHASSMYYNPTASAATEQFLKHFKDRSDGEAWKVYFAVSGTEAVEVALLLARVASPRSPAIISMENSYHGSYGTAMGASGINGCTHPLPETNGIFHLPVPIYPGDDASAAATRDSMTRLINASIGGQVAGCLIEAVQGYGGIHCLNKEFMQTVADVTREAGGLVIMDEVQSGFSRLGEHFWAYESSGVEPDIVTVAKGLGNGFPISAVVAKESVFDAFLQTGKFLFSTYGANPVACAAALGVLQAVEEDNVAAHCAMMGKLFAEAMGKLQARYPHIIADVRGGGLMWGIEIGDPATAYDVFETLMLKHHVLVGLGGSRKNVLRFMPPMSVQPHDLDFFIEKLSDKLQEVEASL